MKSVFDLLPKREASE